MIHIQKGKPPKKFVEFKKQNPHAHFDDIPSDIKAILRTSLLKEQGYLCAYCMCRLNDNHNEVKIEHYQPRNSDNELDYNNLLAVCTGNSTNNEPCRQHCDTKKGNTKLHIDPQQVAHIHQISYDSNGTIIAKENLDFTHDLNCTLNLNDDFGYLKENRRCALKALKDTIYRKFKDKPARIAFANQKLNFYSTMTDGKYPAYCGILIDYLMRHLKKWLNG